LVTNVPYGLFYKRFGIWLDQNKTAVSYEILAQDVLELRAITQEFLIRIQVPQHDTRFTIKVIPSFQVSDLISIILSNMENRKLRIEPLSTGLMGVDQTCHYGLYVAQANSWLNESKRLAEYQSMLVGQDVQFRIQYKLVTVQLPSSRTVQILSAETTSVSDLLCILCAEYSEYEEDSNYFSSGDLKSEHQWFALYTKSGEKLRNDELLWNILADNSPLVSAIGFQLD
jgi:hypothetical protein